MSSSRLGMTIETVGRPAQLDGAGNAENGSECEPGILLKLAHGTCLRAYLPALQSSEPGAGRLSANPTKLWPAASSCEPRLDSLPALTGQTFSLTSVLPANNA